MFARFWFVIVVIICSRCCGNNIINGGAESGDLVPWQHTNGLAVVTEFEQQTGLVTPFSGDYFFSMAGHPGTEETLIQIGTFDTAQTGTTILSGYVQTESNDFAFGRLGLFDVDGGSIVEGYTDMLQTEPLTWAPFSVELQIDVPTLGWFVEFYGAAAAPGPAETNVYLDAIALTVVPEPTIATMISCTLLFMLVRQKHQNANK